MSKPTRKLFPVLFLSNFILAGILVVGLGWYTIDALKDVYRSAWVHHMEQALDFAEERIRQVSEPNMEQEFRQIRATMHMRVTLMDSSGDVLFDSDTTASSMENHRSRPEFQQAMATGRGEATRFSATVSKSMLYEARKIHVGTQTLVLRMSTPLVGIDAELKQAYSRWFGAVGLAIVLAALFAYWVSLWLVGPIRALRAGAERFAHGDLQQKLPRSNWVEVQSLADSLNHMAGQLDDRIRSMALQKNETEAVLASLIEGVVALDHQNRILRCNMAFLELFHIQGRTVVGRSMLEVVRNAELDEFIEGKFSQRDIVVVEEQGSRTLAVRGSVLRNPAGQDIGSLLVLNDVTRIRQLEHMRSDFVANVSHELKTPITSIKGYVETLQDMKIGEDKDAHRFLDIVARQADRLNAIVDDLLTLSRIEQDGRSLESEFQQIDLVDLVDSVVQAAEPAATRHQIRIEQDVPPGITVSGNAGLLEQALLNLVTNACKYTESGKLVKVSVCVQKGVRISVVDQGFGIEQRHLPRIFERFYRVDKARSRHLGGTGLGLAISKHIALMHSGRIEVQSEVGVGSTFTLILPVISVY